MTKISKFSMAGRPLKYETPADLLAVVEKYFEETPQEQMSITGLALVVGSKQLIQDYEKRDGYSGIIKRAKLVVENAYEQSLREHGRTGDIFALKNFGWTDRHELTGADGQPLAPLVPVIVFSEDAPQTPEIKESPGQ
jgi:DNA-packaging protein gp3